ncbi:tyrosine-type recombinase/integrase [Geoglobus ahangari]
MHFTRDDIRAFLIYLGAEFRGDRAISRNEEEIRTSTLEDLRKKLYQFYDITYGELSPSSILSFINDRSRYQDPGKYINPAVRFLTWLQDVRGEDYSNLVRLLEGAKPKRTRRKKKAYAERGSVFDVTLEDVHTHILNIYRSDTRTIPKLRAITASALAASTGLRPEELKRLEPSDIDPIQHYFILPAEKSKTHTERVIPLHPQVRIMLNLLLRYSRSELLFSDGSIRHVFSRAGTLKLKQFRKFFAIYSPKVGLKDVYRIAIMGHDSEELEKLLQSIKLEVTEEFYRKFTPEAITQEYMKTWGRVRIVPERVKFS